jgi:tetratricopeptide (TPR) repeat protein
VHQYIYANAVNFVNRARRQPARKEHFCQMARKELQPFENESLGAGAMPILSLRAELLYLEGKYTEAIALSEEILQTKLALPMGLSNLRNIIQSHMELGEFKEAFGTIQKMLQITNDPSRYATEVRFLFHSACCCYYEMGEYAQSISIGSAAVESNRHYEGVHKYIALSYQALGRYDEAILTMRRAVRYETPWDAAHVAACQALLEEIIAGKGKVETGKESGPVA